jgi:hypothetical protein
VKPIILATSLVFGALPAVAVADGDGVPASPPVAADPAVTGGALAAAAPAEATPRYPSAMFDRPLTLPSGLMTAGPDVTVSKSISVDPTTGMTSSSTANALALTAGYGITDALEINTLTPTYGLGIAPSSSGKGPIDVGVGYALLRGALGGKFEMIGRAVVGYDLGASALRPIRIGVHFQYNLTSRIGLISHDIGFGNLGLSVAVDGKVKPSYLTVPLGIAYQATPTLWIEADTALATSVKLSDSANVSIRDVTPVFCTALFNTLGGRLDLLGYVGAADAQHAGDTFAVGVGARYYVGKI